MMVIALSNFGRVKSYGLVCSVLYCGALATVLRISFGRQVPKLNFYIRFLDVHVILNQSQDAIWHFLTKFT
jgi:hypothetical protein